MKDRLDILGVTHNQTEDEINVLEELHNINIVTDVLTNMIVNSSGLIVEYGSWRGKVLDELAKLYGSDRVL